MSVLFGLTAQNSNEEILKTAFQKVHEIRWIPFATTGADGLPSCRTIDFNLLSDGNIYFETEVGKPIYSDLQRCPVGTLCAIIGDGDKIHNKLMLRIKALVECVDPNESIVDEFFARNPGTMSLFTKAPNVMKIFRLVLGQGELYQTYRDDAVAFLRFTFGEIEPQHLAHRAGGYGHRSICDIAVNFKSHAYSPSLIISVFAACLVPCRSVPSRAGYL